MAGSEVSPVGKLVSVADAEDEHRAVGYVGQRQGVLDARAAGCVAKWPIETVEVGGQPSSNRRQ
jgi:hypothetical protein